MVQLTKSTSRLLSKVENREWATSDDHEDPIQSDEAFINGEPLSSSDGEDANEKANIPPSRVAIPAKRKSPPVRESPRKSARFPKSEEKPGKVSTQKASGRKRPELGQSRGQFGRDDVIFADSQMRKSFKNFHAGYQAVKTKNTNSKRDFREAAKLDEIPSRRTAPAFKVAQSLDIEEYNESPRLNGDTRTDTEAEEPSKLNTKSATLVNMKKSKASKSSPVDHGLALKEPSKPRATFKSYVLSQATPGSTSSSPPTSIHPSGRTGFTPEPDNKPEPDPVDTKCPMCGSEISFLELEIFQSGWKGTRPTVREQQDFCVKHKNREAEKLWEERGYPDLDWDRLSHRLSKYHSNIKRLLAKPQESHFRREMDKRAKQGNARTLLQQMEKEGFDGVSLGYYGTRGLDLIMDYIMSKFSERIRSLAGSDRTIANRGPSGYVQMVLAPELATLLIMEDMSVDEQRARAIMKESIEVGDRLHGKEESEQRKKKTIPTALLVDEDDGEDEWTRTQIM